MLEKEYTIESRCEFEKARVDARWRKQRVHDRNGHLPTVVASTNGRQPTEPSCVAGRTLCVLMGCVGRESQYNDVFVSFRKEMQ